MDYTPLLLQVVVVTLFASGMIVGSMLLGKRGAEVDDKNIKNQAYECGMLPKGKRPRFSVKFYLVAMLFVIFDIEAVFLFPWALRLREELELGTAGNGLSFIIFAAIFIGVLFIAYLYALKRGALDWSKN